MKHLFVKTMAFVAVLALLYACGAKNESETTAETATEELEEWKEMDAFHMVMAEAFHPYKDSTNLEPAKAGAEAMAAEAEKWASAALPAKVDNEQVKAALAQLKTDTRAFADKVAAGSSNEELGAALTNLHDQFHAIMEAWHGGGGHKHGEH